MSATVQVPTPPNQSTLGTTQLGRQFASILFVATLFIGGVGASTYRVLHRETLQATERTLAVIAEEKRERIEHWVKETRRDAKLYFSGTSLLPILFGQWQESGRGEVALLDRMRTHLAEVMQARGWQGIALYDAAGQPVFHLGEVDPAEPVAQLPGLLRHPRIEPIDLHRNAHGTVDYGVLAPIGPSTATPLGVAYVSWRADQTLYPLVRSWPVPTQSAETYLIRREDHQLRYLTPLRQQPDSALTLTQPWTSFKPIADYASQSLGDVVPDTRDYRGVPISAYLTAIAGTPWLMMATIDQHEIDGGIRSTAWATSLITALALLLMYGAGYLVWRRELAGLTERRRMEEVLRLSEERQRLHLEELVKARTLELIKARDAAEAADRAKSDFLTHMTHELRTPLHAILGFTDVLFKMEDRGHDPVGARSGDRRTETSRHRRKLLAILQRNGQHLLALVNDVLDLSRLERGGITLDVRPTNLPGLLHDCVFDLTPLALDKGLALYLDIAPGLAPGVQVDRRRLRQVLHNLLGNAIKFTTRGEVRLRAATTPDPTETARVALRFTVMDTGSGIPAAEQERIFDAFAQAATGPGANAPQGTGLGLAISRHLIRQMGGEIHLESEPDQGSRFTLTLPAIAVADAIDCDAHRTADDPRGVPDTTPGPACPPADPPLTAPPPIAALVELRELAELGRTTRLEDWCRRWSAPERHPDFATQVLKLVHGFEHERIIALVNGHLGDAYPDPGPDPDADAAMRPGPPRAEGSERARLGP